MALNRTSDVDSSGKIRITARQIYIIPTRFGFIFAVLLIGMLIGSNNYGINLGFILTFFLAGIGFAAMLQSWRNLVNLEITPGNVESVFCGENAEFKFDFNNTKPSARPAIQLKYGKTPIAFDLSANQYKTLTYLVRTRKRGFFVSKRWTVMSYYPFGMFYVWAYFSSDQACLVYPAPTPRDVPLREIFNSSVIDKIDIKDNQDFFGHSKYQPGDNMKRLDWKALARGRGKLLKLFRNNVDNDIWLNWDEVKSNDTENTLSILCRAVIELTELKLTFGLNVPGKIINPDQGLNHKLNCLHTLALFKE